MSITETIKSLEEADDKLKKATVLELAAAEMQKNAARSRDESRDILAETVIQKEKVESLQFVQAATLKQKEEELRNREVTLAAEKSDLAHQIAERTKDLDLREASLNASAISLDKGIRQNKEQEAEFALVRDRYKSVADFIAKTL